LLCHDLKVANIPNPHVAYVGILLFNQNMKI
jgi:hypothetical protein